MQLALGDYRKKMIEEEKKLRKGRDCDSYPDDIASIINFLISPIGSKGNTSIEFIDNSTRKGSASDSKSANSQCHFVKKSFTASLGESSFQFKFPVDEIGKLSLENPVEENGTSKICDKNTLNENSLATVPQQSHQIDSNPFVKTKLSKNSFKFNFKI